MYLYGLVKSISSISFVQTVLCIVTKKQKTNGYPSFEGHSYPSAIQIQLKESNRLSDKENNNLCNGM